jgi:hypothetical protein
MKTYLGTKQIKARRMTRGEYNTYRGWTPPEGEDQSTEGYLVEYGDGGKPNHPDHEGYISWSPADVFEKSYRHSDGLTFGLALEALKQGKAIARKGWNGKGMFLFLLPGGRVPKTAIHDPGLRKVIDEQVEGDSFEALPSIRMWTTNAEGRRAVLTGWLASQTDMLSDDWQIVETDPDAQTNSH